MRNLPPNICKSVLVLGTLLLVPFLFLLVTGTEAKENLVAEPVLGEGPTEIFGYGQEVQNQPESPTVSTGSEFVFLPLVTRPLTCTPNAQEQEIANLAIGHPSQGRSFMNCDPTLEKVARERALDMGTRGYFSHTNPDGFGPNYLVRQAGYSLPSWYGSANDANNIESIAAGYGTVTAVWNGWLNSSGHRTHILAESDFWKAQTNYGIGYVYVPGSPYGHYWVFISAPPEE